MGEIILGKDVEVWIVVTCKVLAFTSQMCKISVTSRCWDINIIFSPLEFVYGINHLDYIALLRSPISNTIVRKTRNFNKSIQQHYSLIEWYSSASLTRSKRLILLSGILNTSPIRILRSPQGFISFASSTFTSPRRVGSITSPLLIYWSSLSSLTIIIAMNNLPEQDGKSYHRQFHHSQYYLVYTEDEKEQIDASRKHLSKFLQSLVYW